MKTKEAKHTPGPWEIELPSGRQEKDGILPSVNATGFRGEICCGVFKKADAQLIAAAPEMLEALKVARKMIEACWTGKPHPRNCFCLPDRCPRKQVDRAIAKATGAKATGEEGR